MFAPENWVMADTCDTKTPCELFIDAMEDSILMVSEKEETIQNINVNALVKRLATLENRATHVKLDTLKTLNFNKAF
jgi:hypothetical protein